MGVHLADKDAYPPQGYPGGQGYGIGNPPPPQYQYPPHPQYVVQPPPHRNTQSGGDNFIKGWYFSFLFLFYLAFALIEVDKKSSHVAIYSSLFMQLNIRI